jgi:nitrogen-specific signal transduction histidine kinase
MPIDSTTRNSGVNYSQQTETPDALKAKTCPDTHEAASGSDSQELLLRAQRNAVEAKEAAVGAINRFYQESKVSEKKAEKMVNELEDAIQLALNATQKTLGKDEQQTGYDDGRSTDLQSRQKKSKVSRRILNPNPLNAVFDLKNALFGSKPTEDEVKEGFYRLVMRQSPQLRQLIDELTEDKAKIKTDRIMTEAKSEIIAARVAVNKAQEEIATARDEAKKALLDSENTQKAAQLIVSQVKQEAITQAANEITRAHEEVKAIKEAANGAIKRAEEDIKRSREEAATLSNHAHVTLTLAQEKVKKDAEELKAYKLQAQITMRQAQEETRRAREEMEALRRESKDTIAKAAAETAQAKEDMELARQTVQEATVTAEKQAYDRFCEEMKRMREEVEITNRTAYDAIAKARGESQRARNELDALKKSSEEALFIARQEAQDARKETERTKQSLLEIIGQAQEESHQAREEAGISILRANEAIIQAKKDIINMTRGEIVKARHELEAPGSISEPQKKADEPAPASNLDADYVATVLHEMRTPLHSICGFAKLMLDENVTDDSTRKEFLSIMVQQSDSLNKLIDDLSHILFEGSAGKREGFDIHKEPLSSRKVISEAIESVQGMAQQKKNLVSHNLTSGLPEIEADATRIKQVIVNLLVNAIKFSPEGSSIAVKAGVKNRELVVQVIDHGIGIPAEELQAVFDKYYQAENRGDAEGTGLGLYICRQIIEAHGGRIWAESAEGQGSVFSFSLPVAARQ